MEQLVPTKLFGGAIELHIPARFCDVSDARPVPDHQEVFADPAHDQSVLVEINEIAEVDNTHCGRFLFDDLATANSATASSIDTISPLGPDDIPGVPPDCYKCLVSGQQVVAKHRQGAEASNEVHILLAIIRLPHVRSDLLITLNTPLYISPHSAAAAQAGSGVKHLHHEAPALLAAILKTLSIHDWGLFSGPELDVQQ